MNDRSAADIFDDGGIAACIFQRQMDIGFVAVGRHLDDLDLVKHIERLLHGRRVVQGVLRPQAGLQARLVAVARAEVGLLQIKHVCAEATLVQSVGGADAVDRGDQACVFGRPARRIVRDRHLRAGTPAVAAHPARQHGEDRLGRFRPIHCASDDDRELVVVPQDARAGIGDLRRRQHGACCRRRDHRDLEIENGSRSRFLLRHARPPVLRPVSLPPALACGRIGRGHT